MAHFIQTVGELQVGPLWAIGVVVELEKAFHDLMLRHSLERVGGLTITVELLEEDHAWKVVHPLGCRHWVKGSFGSIDANLMTHGKESRILSTQVV